MLDIIIVNDHDLWLILDQCSSCIQVHYFAFLCADFIKSTGRSAICFQGDGCINGGIGGRSNRAN